MLTKNLAAAVSIVLLLSANVRSQTSALVDAFALSYSHEATLDYQKAADALTQYYAESNYEINLRLGWLNYKLGKYEDAMEFYRKAINLMPYSTEARLGFNLPASAALQWDLVIEQYSKILENDPQNTFVNYQLGYIYYDRKQYEDAMKHFEKVVNLYPFGYDGVIMLGWTNYMLGKYKEAKVLFEKALMIIPGSESALQGLGLMK